MKQQETNLRPGKNQSTQFSVSTLIRSARGTHTQEGFAKLIGTTQPLLCKYETGKIPNPPAKIIVACLQYVHDRNNSTEITIGFIQRRMREVLSGPERADVRRVISELLDCLELSR